MATNPYMSPDDDSDLYADQPSTEVATTDEANYLAVGPDGKPLPDHIQKMISPYYQTGNQSNTMPIEFKAIAICFQAFARINAAQSEGVLLLATTDALTHGGDVQLHFEIRKSQQMLITTKIILDWVEYLSMVYGSETPNDAGDLMPTFKNSDELLLYLEIFGDMIAWRRDRAADTYRMYADKMGIEVDEAIIEEGKFTSRNYLETAALYSPPAKDTH